VFDCRDILTEWFSSSTNQLFTLGLGVSYRTSPRLFLARSPKLTSHSSFSASSNLLNRETPDWPTSTVLPGQRAPDCKVSRVGTAEAVWLQRTALINDGRFNLVVFTGETARTLPSLQHLQSYLASDKSFTKRFPARKLFRFTSIILGEGIGAEEYTGIAPFGVPYFDPLRVAHETYGVDTTRGAVAVFRPDGYVATVVGLEETSVLDDYFGGFLVEGAH
jgi:phenol 2-monooxygenase (NADPH)